jgi:hypothetical protein
MSTILSATGSEGSPKASSPASAGQSSTSAANSASMAQTPEPDSRRVGDASACPASSAEPACEPCFGIAEAAAGMSPARGSGGAPAAVMFGDPIPLAYG